MLTSKSTRLSETADEGWQHQKHHKTTTRSSHRLLPVSAETQAPIVCFVKPIMTNEIWRRRTSSTKSTRVKPRQTKDELDCSCEKSYNCNYLTNTTKKKRWPYLLTLAAVAAACGVGRQNYAERRSWEKQVFLEHERAYLRSSRCFQTLPRTGVTRGKESK